MQTDHGAYELDDSPSRIDADAVWDFLSRHAYWQRWRTREDVDGQVEGAWRVVGAFEKESGRQVGFARAFSDGGTAFLADVYVLEEVRGRGLGVAIVKQMIEEGPGADYRWALHTRDAHDLYRRFGFGDADSTYMERPAHRPEAESREGQETPEGDAADEGAVVLDLRSTPTVRSVDLVELENRLRRLLKDRHRPGHQNGTPPDGMVGAEVAGLDTLVGGCLDAWESTGELDDTRRGELTQGIADLDELTPQLTGRREVQHVARLREIADTLSQIAKIT